MKKKDDILDVDEWTTNREQPVCSLERIREIRREVLCEKSEPSVLESEVLGRPHKDPLFEKKKAEQKTREEHFFVEKKTLTD